MKVVFPCSGSIVLTKEDLQVLQDFYENNLVNSKAYPLYSTCDYILQVGNFNYLPIKSRLIIEDNASLLTIAKLRGIIDSAVPENAKSDATAQAEVEEKTEEKVEEVKEEPVEGDEEDMPIKDEDILNNPFFTTLKPVPEGASTTNK